MPQNDQEFYAPYLDPKGKASKVRKEVSENVKNRINAEMIILMVTITYIFSGLEEEKERSNKIQ